MKNTRQMERHFKGISNHHRLDILLLVSQNPGIIVEDIAKRLDCNFNTISVHTNKLAQAGLLEKKYRGRAVEHILSLYGKKFLSFIKDFQKS